MSKSELISSTLLAAANRIERSGLFHGDLRNGPDAESCQVCMLGGLGYAYFGSPEEGYSEASDDETYAEIVELVAREVGGEQYAYRRTDREEWLRGWNHVTDPDLSHNQIRDLNDDIVYCWNDASLRPGDPGFDEDSDDEQYLRGTDDAVALLRGLAAKQVAA